MIQFVKVVQKAKCHQHLSLQVKVEQQGLVVCLKLKSEVKSIMKQFTTLIKNQFNFTAGTYCSDEGGEYNDRELLKNLKDLGIDIQ